MGGKEEERAWMEQDHGDEGYERGEGRGERMRGEGNREAMYRVRKMVCGGVNEGGRV